MSTERDTHTETAQLLTTLTKLPFKVEGDKVVAEGGDAKGYRRLHYLTKAYNDFLQIAIGDKDERAEVQNVDLDLLRRLAQKEPKRLEEGRDAALYLGVLTKQDWKWNGLFHELQPDLETRHEPFRIFNLQRDGSIPGKYGILEKRNSSNIGDKTTEVHAVDNKKLLSNIEYDIRTVG